MIGSGRRSGGAGSNSIRHRMAVTQTLIAECDHTSTPAQQVLTLCCVKPTAWQAKELSIPICTVVTYVATNEGNPSYHAEWVSSWPSIPGLVNSPLGVT